MGYLMAITRDFHAAEEIFQNAAVVVIEHSESEDPIRNFRAWAKEIVRRQALLFLRKRSTHAKHVRAMEPDLLEQIGRVFVGDQTADDVLHQEITALEQCIQQVPEHGKKMLSMRYEKQASFQQIGKTVEKTEAAVQRALCRLRKSLHDCVRSKTTLSTKASP